MQETLFEQGCSVVLGFERLISNKIAWQISQGYNPFGRSENIIPWKYNFGRKFR